MSQADKFIALERHHKLTFSRVCCNRSVIARPILPVASSKNAERFYSEKLGFNAVMTGALRLRLHYLVIALVVLTSTNACGRDPNSQFVEKIVFLTAVKDDAKAVEAIADIVRYARERSRPCDYVRVRRKC